MLQSTQFLDILAAENELLLTVSIHLPPEAKSAVQRNLNEAFASDSYSDTARAWNEERLRVVQEAIEKHLIPVGVKWTREWLREEAEDLYCKQCAHKLRDVRPSLLDVYLPAYFHSSGSMWLLTTLQILNLVTHRRFSLCLGATETHRKM